MRRNLISLLVTLATASPLSAPAQTWPTRPIFMVVPFAAGGKGRYDALGGSMSTVASPRWISCNSSTAQTSLRAC